ncbi:MAG: HD domain-containing protein, partial [Xanthomonadales bacterium]|nr:HD domain-containing protein [Xanthomonadales bacterium]
MNIHSSKALKSWLSGYHDSVGGAADECLQLYDELRQCELADGKNLSQMHELLDVLSNLSPDPHTVSCAMLFVASEWGEDLKSIRSGISTQVNDQLGQLLYLIELETEHLPASTSHSAEGLRRMLLALVKDVRVVLIALAWQLVKLRRVKNTSADAVSLAREAMLIHAPLANRLGVWQLKWELEDLAFRYDQPGDYQRVARLVAERRTDRERYIRSFMEKLGNAIHDAGIKGEVKG